MVFTDGSSIGMAALVIDNQTFTFKTPYKSAQLVGLFAIIQVFKKLPNNAFNVYTDSAYVAFSVPLLESVTFY